MSKRPTTALSKSMITMLLAGLADPGHVITGNTSLRFALYRRKLATIALRTGEPSLTRLTADGVRRATFLRALADAGVPSVELTEPQYAALLLTEPDGRLPRRMHPATLGGLVSQRLATVRASGAPYATARGQEIARHLGTAYRV